MGGDLGGCGILPIFVARKTVGKMRRLLLSILFLGLCARSAAVLNERTLGQSLSVLRVELAMNYNELKQTVESLETASKAQHAEMIDIMKRSNKTALMLYSQNMNYTFNQAYACHEASEQYYRFSKKMMPYGRFLETLNTEIDRYNRLISTLQSLPPRVTLQDVLKDKSAAETLKREAAQHARTDKGGKNGLNVTVTLLGAARGLGGWPVGVRRPGASGGTAGADAAAIQGHQGTGGNGGEPFMLDGKGRADRAECIKFAMIIRTQYVKIRDNVEQDSKNYERLKDHLRTIHEYAQQHYKAIQKNIFVNGDRSYFSILADLDKYVKFSSREIRDKYASKNYDYNHVRSEWRGPVIFGLVLAVFFYFALAFAVSSLAVRMMMKRVKRLRESETMRLKANCIITAASLIVFALASMIAKNSVGHNFFIMAFGLLVNYAWLVAVVLISLLIRLNGKQIKSTLPLFLPIIVLGFIIIVFRIIFIPNTLVNLVFPVLLIIFFVWQLYVLRHVGSNAKAGDRAYAWVSLALMGVATVMAWAGFVLMSVEIFIWWLFQLMFILTITSIYDLLMTHENRFLLKKLDLKESLGQGCIKRNNKFIQYTWMYDFFAMCLVPVGAVWSFLWSIYLSADVFDLTEMVMKIFITPFVDVQGVCRMSIFMIVLVASLYFIFNFICYTAKGTYRYLKMKNLAAKNKGVAVATNQANFTLFYNITAIVVWGTYFVLALFMLQVPKSGISIVTAGLATGIGFAMKDLLNNFFYGMSLMTGRLRVGDWIECDGVRGKVDSITYQSTQVATEDGSIIAFLNSTLFNKNFQNLTRNHLYVASKIPVGVAYGTDVDRVRTLLTEAVTKMMYRNKSGRDVISPQKGVSVRVYNLGESSIDLVVVYWTLVEEKSVFDLKVKETIYKTLSANGIEIPFPQRDIRLRGVNTAALGDIAPGQPL